MNLFNATNLNTTPGGAIVSPVLASPRDLANTREVRCDRCKALQRPDHGDRCHNCGVLLPTK